MNPTIATMLHTDPAESFRARVRESARIRAAERSSRMLGLVTVAMTAGWATLIAVATVAGVC